MENQNLIHIMSAGQNMHKTFPVAIQRVAPATKLYIIVENRVFEVSDDDVKNNARKLIRDSIDELKKISEPFVTGGIEVVVIKDDTLDIIRENIFEIYKKNKDAKYYLNISSGTKGLAVGLFMMALWIDAIPYHVDRDNNARIISIPQIHIKDFKENRNRAKILELINDSPDKCLSRKKLHAILSEEYKPVKKIEGKHKRQLSYGGFNSLIEDLINWGFIESKNVKGSKKEIEYHITPDGQFTLQFVNL
jgi:hypothetical protein